MKYRTRWCSAYLIHNDNGVKIGLNVLPRHVRCYVERRFHLGVEIFLQVIDFRHKFPLLHHRRTCLIRSLGCDIEWTNTHHCRWGVDGRPSGCHRKPRAREGTNPVKGGAMKEHVGECGGMGRRRELCTSRLAGLDACTPHRFGTLCTTEMAHFPLFGTRYNHEEVPPHADIGGNRTLSAR